MNPGRPPAEKERQQAPAFEWPPPDAPLASRDDSSSDAALTPATTTSDVHARRARSHSELAVVPASLSLPRRRSRRSPFALVAGLLLLTVATLIVVAIPERGRGPDATDAGTRTVTAPGASSTSGEAQLRQDAEGSSWGSRGDRDGPQDATVDPGISAPPIRTTPVPDVARSPVSPVPVPQLPTLPEQRTVAPRFGSEAATTESVPAPAAEPSVEDRQAINGVLDRYRDAFDRRSADDVRTLWPGVDRNALARAFSGLRSQALVFDGCVLAISEAAASAVCDGMVRYVPRVGGNTEREQAASWTFTFERRGPGWSILNVAVH